MKSKRTLLVTGVVSAMMLSATLATAAGETLTLTDLSGAVRIHQDLPCDQTLNMTATIQQGLMQITPQQITRAGGVLFDLTRLNMLLTPFSVNSDCRGIRATAAFREIGLSLVSAVRFPGEETGGLGSGLYRFTIPKEKFVIFESILDNAPVPQPEINYRLPSENVTGLIDLNRQTVQLQVVLTSELHFRAGCMKRRCKIDEMHTGTQTADILAARPTR
jgi:hypothetical protein